MAASAASPFRVGIIGLDPGRSWGANAHLPALRAMTDDFTVVGVANSSKQSSEKAAAALNIPRAFATPDELAASPDVDIVAVTVKVPHHAALVRAALAAKKHVFCEWPLGNGLAEARELAALAKESGVLCVVGTQAPFAPEVIHLRRLIAEGFVGKVLSTTLTGQHGRKGRRGKGRRGATVLPTSVAAALTVRLSVCVCASALRVLPVLGTGMVWGAQIDSFNAYTNDKTNGATMLSIPVGHTLAAVVGALGPIAELSAVLANGRTSIHVADKGTDIPMTSPDQVLLQVCWRVARRSRCTIAAACATDQDS